jgi:hypothetical protein
MKNDLTSTAAALPHGGDANCSDAASGSARQIVAATLISTSIGLNEALDLTIRCNLGVPHSAVDHFNFDESSGSAIGFLGSE